MTGLCNCTRQPLLGVDKVPAGDWGVLTGDGSRGTVIEVLDRRLSSIAENAHDKVDDELLSSVKALHDERNLQVELGASLGDESSALNANLGGRNTSAGDSAVPDRGLARVVFLNPEVEGPGGGRDHVAGNNFEGLANVGRGEDALLERCVNLIDATDGDAVGDLNADWSFDTLGQEVDIWKRASRLALTP